MDLPKTQRLRRPWMSLWPRLVRDTRPTVHSSTHPMNGWSVICGSSRTCRQRNDSNSSKSRGRLLTQPSRLTLRAGPRGEPGQMPCLGRTGGMNRAGHPGVAEGPGRVAPAAGGYLRVVGRRPTCRRHSLSRTTVAYWGICRTWRGGHKRRVQVERAEPGPILLVSDEDVDRGRDFTAVAAIAEDKAIEFEKLHDCLAAG